MRVKSEGLIVGVNSPVIIAFGPVGNSPAVLGPDTLRVNLEGLVEVLNCPVILACGPVGRSPVAICLNIVGVESEGLVVGANGPVVFAFARVGNSLVFVGERLFPALALLTLALGLSSAFRLRTLLSLMFFLLGPSVLQQQNT